MLVDQLENGIVLRGVPWSTYMELDRARGEKPYPRLSFLDGDLEIVTTSVHHELRKKLVARFLETYADATGVELNSFGSTTFQNELKAAGLEPDECYYVHVGIDLDDMPAPEIAIEVGWSRSGVNKLEIYRRLGAAEVWLWERDQLDVYRLVRGKYRRLVRSRSLPELDLADLARRVRETDPRRQASALRAYRKSLAE